jgi:hypothetical protein
MQPLRMAPCASGMSLLQCSANQFRSQDFVRHDPNDGIRKRGR